MRKAGSPLPKLITGFLGPATVLVLTSLGLGCGQRPDISLLLITIDTARADHFSLYGYHRPTSPRLETLARTGVTFELALTPIPQTGPAHASILTGRWPSSLGLHDNEKPLGVEPRTLAEVLQAAGYDTAGFVSGLPLVRRVGGTHRGFAHYDDDMPDPRGGWKNVQRRGAKTTAAALRWLDTRQGPGAFFLWVHYFDPHGDYHPGPPHERMFADGSRGPFVASESIPIYQRRDGSTDAADYIARYDGEVRYVDDEIAKLLGALSARGLTASTLVVVTGDHGEGLLEHNYFFDHGNELYLEAVRVPLVLSGPGVPSDGRRLGGVARHPDIMPTVLELLGIACPPGVEGSSLGPALKAPEAVLEREGFSEARLVPAKPLVPSADVTPKLAVHDDRFTVVWRKAKGTIELYDRSSDPGEDHNLFADSATNPEDSDLRSVLQTRLQARLDAAVRHATTEPTVLSPEVRRRLESWLARRARAR